MPQPAEYEYSIYAAGLGGIKPPVPTGYLKLREAAKAVMTQEAFDYVAGSAGSEDTRRANEQAFQDHRLVPHMLAGASERDLSVRIFDNDLDTPVLLAPIGVQGIIHPDAEVATAKAAAATGVPYVLSTAASRSMEEVAEAAPDQHRWYQLYWPNDKDLTVSFLERAERAGYSAIAVTLDTTILAWRPRDLDNAFLPFLKGEGVGNYFSDPVFCAPLAESPEKDPQAAVMRWVQVFSDPEVTWSDLAFIRQNTKLPLLLKGIQHPGDALRALEAGADGVIVSNHGGRQVDGAIASLHALPGVVAAVGDKMAVLFDSGIRTGADAVKALKLGAKAVLLGRPFAWGLAAGGQAGVEHVIRSFLAELDLTTALCGARRPTDVDFA
jgi:lactate 2-monooxygenase